MNVVIDTETTGLDPWVDRLVSISYSIAEETDIICVFEEDEKKMLEIIMKFLEEKKPMLIGFNIGFDMTFLRIRSLKNRVNCSVLDKLLRIDIKQVVQGINQIEKRHMRLSDYYAFFGFANNSFESSGYSVPTLFLNKEFEKIREHSMKDVKKTRDIYLRLKECGLI